MFSELPWEVRGWWWQFPAPGKFPFIPQKLVSSDRLFGDSAPREELRDPGGSVKTARLLGGTWSHRKPRGP